MLEMILLFLTLNPLKPVTTTAQFQPCVWPNKCAKPAAIQVVQFQPCVWPNKCAKPAAKTA